MNMNHELEQKLSALMTKFDAFLTRVDRLLPPPVEAIDWTHCLAARWQTSGGRGSLQAIIPQLDIELTDIHYLDEQKYQLVNNTEQFLSRLPANHTLLTGARGCGKSSLIKALLKEYHAIGLRLIEVGIDDLMVLGDIVQTIISQSKNPQQDLSSYAFIVYCDDLSFELGDQRYKALKVALEGSLQSGSYVESRVRMLVYASSNRRHLMPDMWQDNTGFTVTESGEIHASESVEEKVALSDRFGLWLSFYPFTQEQYLMLAAYWVGKLGATLNFKIDFDELARTEALRFALARSVRSGRIAKQFAQFWVGQHMRAVENSQ